MTTVQLAINDEYYVSILRRLLSPEGFNVLVVEKPDSSIPGLIVLSDSLLDQFITAEPDRLVVIVDKQAPHALQKLWNAGLRSVISSDHAPEVTNLAVTAAHFRFLARSDAPDYSILDDEGVVYLEENGLQGPFTLTDSGIDDAVRLNSPGVFALDDRDDGTGFRIVFVGRSDIDVNNQLHVYVGAYKRFKFIYSSSSRAAFETECLLFHDFDPYDNHYHPHRPAGSRWTCPGCKLLG
ncbi:MAG TPA: hypothetical protein VMH05_02550 [Bryobacteraceae bacterium]|nr:hypothetical protein [Bryobacteraceae bacterium]